MWCESKQRSYFRSPLWHAGDKRKTPKWLLRVAARKHDICENAYARMDVFVDSRTSPQLLSVSEARKGRKIKVWFITRRLPALIKWCNMCLFELSCFSAAPIILEATTVVSIVFTYCFHRPFFYLLSKPCASIFVNQALVFVLILNEC